MSEGNFPSRGMTMKVETQENLRNSGVIDIKYC